MCYNGEVGYFLLQKSLLNVKQSWIASQELSKVFPKHFVLCLLYSKCHERRTTVFQMCILFEFCFIFVLLVKLLTSNKHKSTLSYVMYKSHLISQDSKSNQIIVIFSENLKNLSNLQQCIYNQLGHLNSSDSF